MQKGLTSYDTVVYPSYTHPQTHPNRLAVIGSLFGLDPTPTHHCRVLELGCGNGANLLPMAWTLPESEFVGIDLAAKPIESGTKMLQALKLTNARLVCGSLTEIDQTWGTYDYIIAHGLYSWVPMEIRNHVMSICQGHLSPRGIAFISYNALPGCHLRNMLREMLLFHVRGFDNAEERIEQSLALVRTLADAQDTDDEYRRWMKAEAERISEHDEGHLYHDELGELNEPLYFTQFIEHATRHDLQYLGEADYFEMSDHNFKEPVRKALTQLSRNRILREQYLDFFKCRRFRQTLLCHRSAKLQPEPSADSISQFYVSSAATCTDAPATRTSESRLLFKTPKGAKVETDFTLGQAALFALNEVWPQPLHFTKLLEQARTRLGNHARSTSDDSIALREFLLQIYGAGVVEFRTGAPTFTSLVTQRPVASPVARWQVERGDFVTSMFHMAVKIEDEIGRRLLTWLDGTHDRQALIEKLWGFLKAKGALNLTGSNEADVRQKLESELEKNLVKLARLGLLVK